MSDHICACCGRLMHVHKKRTKNWKWHKCGVCLHWTLGITYAENKKAQMNNDEPNNYARRYPAGAQIRRASVIKQHCSPHSVLDVGCGTGFFMLQFPEAEARVGFSLDVATQAPDPEISVIHEDFQESKSSSPCFDLVTAWHVIEHTLDPVGAMRHLIDFCRPGGMVGIELPAQRHLAPREKYGLHPHRFSIPSIAYYLRQFQDVLRYVVVGPAFRSPGVFALARKSTKGKPMSFSRLMKDCEQGGKTMFRQMELQRYGAITKIDATREDVEKNLMGLKEPYRTASLPKGWKSR